MKTILIIISVVFMTPFFGQSTLKWTKIEDLKDSLAKQSKPVLIKIETQWCSVCKMMDMKVFADKKVQKTLISDYYLVKLDAESKNTIKFNDTSYHYLMYSVNRGVHQLAKKLGEENGKLNYPTILILDNYNIQKRLVGCPTKSDFIFWLKS